MLRYGSICSGIEAATVAVAPLGWDPVFYAEIEPFCCALLQHHYPTVPNVGDFTRIGKEVSVGTVDVVIGGTPCQSFSVAGQRGGLVDPRGNLSLEYFALLDRLRPRWMVWENVPGLLSDNGGRTFGTCLGLLAELGYGFAYRVLDAQYFGVPQRRHRVFTIAYLGDWRPAAAVLFERHSLSGDPPPGRQTGEGLAACLTQGVDSQGKGGYAGRRREDDVNLVSYRVSSNCGAWETSDRTDSLMTQTDRSAFLLVENGEGSTRRTQQDPVCSAVFSESGHGWWREGVGALPHRTDKDSANGLVIPVQYAEQALRHERKNGVGNAHAGAPMYTLECTQQHGIMLAPAVTQRSGGKGGYPSSRREHLVPMETTIRRLTPRECEALQGLPQDYTRIPYQGKIASDGPRYRAIGNTFAVPVVRWIAQRIHRVQEILVC